jgi:hypothetical protein
LPRQLVESHTVVEIASPRFSSPEISELLQAAGAPGGFPSDKISDFLLALTGGLPVLVAAAARLLTTKNWKVDNATLESFFGGQFAIGAKTDARAMIESTIPDDRARELLYRLTCVVGPISKTQIDQISKIPERIPLAADKLNQLLGLWVQPYAEETFLLSPLVESTLSNRLESNTRRGVHAILAIHLTKRKPTTVLDVITILVVRSLKVPDRRRNVSAPGNRKNLVQGAEDGVRFRSLMSEIDAPILAGDFGQLHNLIR